jgi:D-sedoheptulose 7-phosphate isomerase
MTDPGWDLAGRSHVDALRRALASLDEHCARLGRWGHHLAGVLVGGGRLLVAGNGGSAAHAQHLTAELVGRYLHDRPPFSAIALHADTSAVTAIGNDYGPDAVFARQVAGHGRLGDVLVVLSTSGRSGNVIAATGEARRRGLTSWAVTGPGPNPLAEASDDAICVEADATPTVQEVHQVVVHLLRAAVDRALGIEEGR